MTEETKPNNPPAFPNENGRVCEYSGLSLLDYFAAKAMQGIIATAIGDGCLNHNPIVKESYEIAIAMLKEREKHL